MLSRPAVPLIDLLHASRPNARPNSRPIPRQGSNHLRAKRRYYHSSADGTEDSVHAPTQIYPTQNNPSALTTADLSSAGPSALSRRPSRNGILPTAASSGSVENPHRPSNNPARRSGDAKPKPHPAPVVSPEANPGVRTVWDEDWPHHRSAPRSEGSDSPEQPTSPTARDWAYSSSLSDAYPTVVPTNATTNPAPSRNLVEIAPVTATVIVPSTTSMAPAPVQVVPVATSISAIQLDRSTSLNNVLALPVHRNSTAGQPRADADDTIAPENTSREQEPSTRGVYNRTIGRPREESAPHQWGSDKYDDEDYVANDLRRTGTVTLKEGQAFSFQLFHKPQPIARNWSTLRKRFVAAVTCLNTALIGLLVGIYAGEVPAIQYVLADQHHRVILGNVVLYIAMGLVVFIFWPLPLLHGRRPYTLAALAVALPLQIPQAVVVDQLRGSRYTSYTFGLLFSRALSGLALGFAQINFISTLLDLFGASLQSEYPHGEVVVTSDVRRHGGGIGLWLGIWSWCFIGSLAVGFLIGAAVISGTNVSWGFYISIILIACALLLTVITPETRRSAYRKTMQEVRVGDNGTAQRVARGEIKMHVQGEGPTWWWEEVSAGLYLSFRMIMHTGFLVIALYMGWIYAEIVLVIVLLGNLLSAGYRFRPEYVGLGVLSIAIGALLAVPVSKANIFSRSRTTPPRTDSMTFRPRITWSSHLVRRILFMVLLPIAGIAYTLASKGNTVSFMVPIVFAACIGYISNLAIAECIGVVMETFDTSDLQPGSNSRHRLQSLPPSEKNRRTAYSSFPRVSAGLFVAQSFGFFLAAAATGVGGAVTRKVGAQKATAITAGILAGLTLLLTIVLWRYKDVQVIPNELFGQYFGSARGPAAGAHDDGPQRRGSTTSIRSDRSWRAVIIGNPSGKLRRMNWLELGSLSRWTEIRRLNRLLNRSTTQPLNPGWR